ncbi:unnamed protein product [Strongylus vulgaris]|uniref:Uncharacterized protein n=1 Tax=Strongylus vulgaris TaxID=40348 RepID=A0A3P7I6S9_STRVU|nr:unnamed protein product [Strongylus vulgaris]
MLDDDMDSALKSRNIKHESTMGTYDLQLLM